MKFIIVKAGNVEYGFIFPKAIVHAEFADTIRTHKVHVGSTWTRPFMKEMTVVSAGFVRGERTYGQSESLGIVSRGDDIDGPILFG